MMRSAPASLGLSMRIGTPVRVPGSTTTAGIPSNVRTSMRRISRNAAGTVEQTDTPLTL